MTRPNKSALNVARNFFACVTLLGFASCGGGGGGSGGQVATSSGASVSGNIWKASANVSQNGCGERITAVEQEFVIDGNSVNTGIVTVPLTEANGGFTFGFSETNGNCTRSYLGELSNISGDSAVANFTSTSTCDGNTCVNKWSGTAQQIN